MEQVAPHASNGQQGSRAKWPVAIFLPQFSLMRQEDGSLEASVATLSTMDNSCRSQRTFVRTSRLQWPTRGPRHAVEPFPSSWRPASCNAR